VDFQHATNVRHLESFLELLAENTFASL
jgi:hypothetical protein